MSEKTECPVCKSYTSSVTAAVMNDEPCPDCGCYTERLTLDVLRDAMGAVAASRYEPCGHAVHPAHAPRVLPPERCGEAVTYVPCAMLCGYSLPLGPDATP